MAGRSIAVTKWDRHRGLYVVTTSTVHVPFQHFMPHPTYVDVVADPVSEVVMHVHAPARAPGRAAVADATRDGVQ